LRLHCAQFGICQCAEKRKQTAYEPRKVNKFGRAHGLHHLRGNQKNPTSDNGADYDGGGVTYAQIAGKFRRRFGRWWLAGHGRSEKYSGKLGDTLTEEKIAPQMFIHHIFFAAFAVRSGQRYRKVAKEDVIYAVSGELNILLAMYPIPNVTAVPVITYQVQGTRVHNQI
jgi:hypothetical protein